ncbi:MAG: YggS family pyridoxal phosphate-dependent enzyme [Candidatus Omnitrophica bacterium]|nr:YggS family pyridoxal phosphate-dependent enzyme [Candidatus Omnitrophota bacterium]
MVAENLKRVTDRITKACERSERPVSSVFLVCVTKEAALEAIAEALSLGVTAIGENRVQDALTKYRSVGNKAVWHLIGHLQTNKVKDALKIFSLIHSVDSIRLAQEIDKEAFKLDKVQDVLIQVNVSGEGTKFGIRPEDTIEFFKTLLLYPNINVRGFMTIAPDSDDPEKARPYFRALKQLLDQINNLQLTAYSLQLLSMGMTNDFEVAIEEGSTMVRIGRAIFGE